MSKQALETKPHRALMRVDTEALEVLESVYSEFLGALNVPELSLISRAMVASMAITELRKVFNRPDVLPVLKGLAGSALGFKTDRKYEDRILVEASVEATLKGLPLFGNRFNIIADQFYCTKEGFEFLVAPVAQYSVRLVVHEISDRFRATGGHIQVDAKGQYLRRDAGPGAKNERLETSYSVRVTKNNKVAEENAEGKGKRKWLRDVWARLNGLELPDGELEANGVESTRASLLEADFQETDPTPSLSTQKALEKIVAKEGRLDEIVEIYGPPDTWNADDCVRIGSMFEDEDQ